MPRLLMRHSAVLFGSLLLAALVVLTGCPADGGGGNGNGGNGNGGGDTTPPARAVSLGDITANGVDLLFELENPNSEAVQVGIAVEPAAPTGAMIEFDGNEVPFAPAVRIPLAASGESGATKPIRLAALTRETDYTLTATTFDQAGNAHNTAASETATTLTPVVGLPTNLTAVPGNGLVNLSWTGVSGVAQYFVYRTPAGGAVERIATTTTITATNHTDSTVTNGTTYSYTVRAVNAAGDESGNSNARTVTPRNIDSDGDLLIEISFLEELNNIRYSLDGTTYKTSESDPGVQCGAAGDTECVGYELMNDLDFADTTSYSSGAINTDWRPDGGDAATARNAGWVPIGATGAILTAIFEGNGNAISNLYIRRSGNLGLFRGVDRAVIRNIGVINGMVYGDDGTNSIGMLTGSAISTVVATSYASGGVVDGGGGADNVGGLTGNISGLTFIASYATVTVDGGEGNDNAGGITGQSAGSTIRASYTTRNVNGGAGDDSVGGLMGAGHISDNAIIASYATGDVDGGAGSGDTGGTLVGRQTSSSLTRITVSYGFGTVSNSETAGINGTTLPGGITSASALTLALAGSQWNAAESDTSGAWNFNNSSTPPTLQYADYDGSGTDYACATATNPPAGAVLIAGANCGTNTPDPLPNQ